MYKVFFAVWSTGKTKDLESDLGVNTVSVFYYLLFKFITLHTVLKYFPLLWTGSFNTFVSFSQMGLSTRTSQRYLKLRTNNFITSLYIHTLSLLKSFFKTFYFVLESSRLTMLVSGEQWGDSAIHAYVSILPQTPLPSRLPHNIEQNSLCYTVGPCWLSILNIVVCTCPSQILMQKILIMQIKPKSVLCV